jgi:heme O synthase-like polyprenyltransferase
MTRDPVDAGGIAAVIFGSAVAIGAAATFATLALDDRPSTRRTRRRSSERVRAARRGVELGVIVAALGFLRAVDGLTILTGGFVVAGFVLAELVLATRPAARSG